MREDVTWTIPPACRITEEQYKAILTQTDDRPRDWLLFFIGGNLGLRISEVLHLKPEHFVSGSGVEVIRRKKKTLKKSVLDVSEQVFPIVEDYFKHHGIKRDAWIFPGQAGPCYRLRKKDGEVVGKERLCDGGHMTIRWAQLLWDRALGEASLKIKGRGIHTLRHYDGTRYYERTKDLRATQLHLDHSSPAITQKYADVVDMREKAQKVGISHGTLPWQRRPPGKKGTS
jgi:integrase